MISMNWLIRKYLGQKVAEAAATVLSEQAKAASSRQESPRDSTADRSAPADVAVMFALGSEAGGLVDRLTDVVTRRGPGLVTHVGMLGSARVVAATSGPGREAARKATEAVLHGHHPRWVVAAGFAGGLDARLQRGHLLLADSVIDCHGGRLTTTGQPAPADGANTPTCHTGTLLTVDQIVRSPAEKRHLGNTHHALAVDMETFAVAEACHLGKVPWRAVRVIHDTVDDQLPDEVDHLLRQKTLAARAGAVAGALWRRPASAQDMWRLQEISLEVGQHLTAQLVVVIDRLANTEY